MTHDKQNQAPQLSGTGALRSDQNALIFGQGFSFSGYERDAAFLNLHDGRFVDVSGISGIDSISDGRGAVFADFDNDGDLDIFLTTIQGRGHLLFRNNVGQDQPWVRIEVQGGAHDTRDAVGAVVRVKTAAGVETRIRSTGTGFLSQHDPRLLFGLGSDASVPGIDVTWPDGASEYFAGPVVRGATVVARRGTGILRTVDVRQTRLPDPLTPDAVAASRLRLKVGDVFPALTVRTTDGASLSILSFLTAGRSLLVNVWATWCGPCATEMPELARVQAALVSHGVDLLGLNVDADDDADLPAYLRRLKVDYSVARGGTAAIERIFAGDEVVVPLSFVLDDAGTVREIISGWSARTGQRLSELAAEGRP